MADSLKEITAERFRKIWIASKKDLFQLFDHLMLLKYVTATS